MKVSLPGAAVLVCGCLAAGLVLAACTSPSPAARRAADVVTDRAQASAAAKAAASQAAAHKLAVAREAAARAAAAAAARPRVDLTQVRASDGSLVTVAVFRGTVRYVLHDGSGDPYVPPGMVRARSAVVGAERQRLVAAFNGGFKMSAGAGGYEQEGHVFYSLHAGLASLVIDRSGQARIGVWGHGLPVPGEDVYSVRQNLQPLVLNGKPTGAAYDWGLWGATLGGGEYVARSAVGEDAAGNLIYVGSMSTTPSDLAQALAREGARTAMELDINPAWVQLDVARTPGGTLHAEVYEQHRPADQYLYGWSRDFFTVVAPS
ncbi:MAG: phosphodiester glycosidase family protein [Streptosporangiaceae bacterium]|nr:phosphodiester glycosidase family protein [Streptosporangiaceae bacterium]